MRTRKIIANSMKNEYIIVGFACGLLCGLFGSQEIEIGDDFVVNVAQVEVLYQELYPIKKNQSLGQDYFLENTSYDHVESFLKRRLKENKKSLADLFKNSDWNNLKKSIKSFINND